MSLKGEREKERENEMTAFIRTFVMSLFIVFFDLIEAIDISWLPADGDVLPVSARFREKLGRLCNALRKTDPTLTNTPFPEDQGRVVRELCRKLAKAEEAGGGYGGNEGGGGAAKVLCLVLVLGFIWHHRDGLSTKIREFVSSKGQKTMSRRDMEAVRSARLHRFRRGQ